MYIPSTNLMNNKAEIVEFMQRFSFATIITAKEQLPVATHLPFIVKFENEEITLISHFARANNHWKDIESSKVLVIFSEPHAYISPSNYEKETNVPTWNYISVHAYGKGELLTDIHATAEVLENTIDTYETAYRKQWNNLPEDYRLKLMKGIVAFQIKVTDLQGKEKLSQNRSNTEKLAIISTLSKSEDSNERIIAEYMTGLKP
ncbi:MAG: FMN-binding negative transcriptional regulator [Pelobium sp.]